MWEHCQKYLKSAVDQDAEGDSGTEMYDVDKLVSEPGLGNCHPEFCGWVTARGLGTGNGAERLHLPALATFVPCPRSPLFLVPCPPPVSCEWRAGQRPGCFPQEHVLLTYFSHKSDRLFLPLLAPVSWLEGQSDAQ